MKAIEHTGSLRTTYPLAVRTTSLTSVVLLISFVSSVWRQNDPRRAGTNYN